MKPDQIVDDKLCRERHSIDKKDLFQKVFFTQRDGRTNDVNFITELLNHLLFDYSVFCP